MLGILEPVDTDEERRQIARRPDPATAGIQPHDVSLVGIVGAVIFNLADRPLFQHVLGYLHVGDAATLQDIVIDVLRVGLPGQLFDDSAEDALAEIGVGKALSRRNSQRHILQRPCDQLAIVGRPTQRQKAKSPEAAFLRETIIAVLPWESTTPRYCASPWVVIHAVGFGHSRRLGRMPVRRTTDLPIRANQLRE